MPPLAELEDRKVELTRELQKLSERFEDVGAWDDGESDQVKNLTKEYTEVQTQITSEREKLDKQAAQASSIRDLITAGNDGAQSTDGSGMDIQNLAHRYGQGLPENGQPAKPQMPTFRAGRPGVYEPFEGDSISWTGGQNVPVSTLNHPSYRAAWQKSIKNGDGVATFVTRLSQVYNECNDSGCGTTLGPSDFATGGFMLNPMIFASELQKCCDKTVVMRQLANVVTVTSIGISIPRLRKRMASFAWACECEPPPKCDIPEGDRIEFRPQPWTQCTGICNALLKFTTMNPERLLMDELARDLRESLENGYLYGNGQNQPLGLLSPDGVDQTISPDYPIPTDEFTGAAALNHLISAMCSLPNCAQNNASWLFGNSGWCDILKLVDLNDRHFFEAILTSQGVGQGTSRPSLLGHAVNISESITAGFGAGQTVGTLGGVFGDFSSYLILDGPANDMQRDTNIYSDRTCWVVRGYSGGGVVNDCDFQRLENASP